MVVQTLEYLGVRLLKAVKKVAFLMAILHIVEKARIIHQEDFN